MGAALENCVRGLERATKMASVDSVIQLVEVGIICRNERWPTVHLLPQVFHSIPDRGGSKGLTGQSDRPLMLRQVVLCQLHPYIQVIDSSSQTIEDEEQKHATQPCKIAAAGWVAL